MAKYLGETIVDVKNTEFKTYTHSDWAMYFIMRYGQIDGAHHKTWVLDQVSRILKGTAVIVSEAKWDDGLKEYRVGLAEPSNEYIEWVKEMNAPDKNGDFYSDYDEGIAP